MDRYVMRQLAIVVMVGLLLAPATMASAQIRGNSFTTSDGAHTVEWGPDWDVDRELTEDGDSLSMVMLQSDASILGIYILSLDVGADMMFDLFHESFMEEFEGRTTAVHAWETANTRHALDTISMDSVDLVFYARMDTASTTGDTVLVFLASPAFMFEDAFDAAQADVTVDGTQVFSGDSGAELMAHVDGEEAAQSPSGRSSRTSRSSESSGSTRSSRTAAETYTDRQFGYTVTYGPPWSETQGIAAGDFSLSESSGFSVVGFMGMSTFGLDQDMVISMMSDIWAGNTAYGAEYLGTVERDDRVLIATATAGGGALVQEFVFLPGSTVVIISTVIVGDVEGTVSSLQQNVMIEGEPILRDWGDLDG